MATQHGNRDDSLVIEQHPPKPSSSASSSSLPPTEKPACPSIITERAAFQALGYSFPSWKKWAILTSIFIVQISMNFNTTIYANAVSGMTKEFNITERDARNGQMIFLVLYAFGCEAWAPWSEELGRKWILQGSLFLVNCWQIPCALSTNWSTVLAFRGLGGLSSAGGSVTLGMVADMWGPDEQQNAVSFVVFASVAGSVVGPIVGGFVEEYLHWRWVFWIQLIFGVAAQLIHLFVPETCTSILLDREAKRLRKSGENPNVYGPNESKGTLWQRLDWKECCILMWRPYKFLLKEPIVGFLSLLSGFSDALIFTGLESFSLVLAKWNFSTIATGLSFNSLMIGYIIGYISFLVVYRRDRKISQRRSEPFAPERRLWWLLYLVILEPVGLLGFAFTALGPPVHWIWPLFFAALIGIANLAIYQASIDYLIAAYGPYSASATGGNGFCRDFLAGISALYATPFYTNIAHGTKWQLVIPSVILAGIAVLLCIPVYVFYFKGQWFREKSPYATGLAEKRATDNGGGSGEAGGHMEAATSVLMSGGLRQRETRAEDMA